MKFIPTLSAAVALLSSVPAFAADTLITFEGTSSFLSVAEFYNGGTDGGGLAGANFGVSFGGAALSIANDVLGPYFSNAPTPGSVMFAQDASAVMNVASGFAGGLSFYYASSASTLDAVTIYSGLNGTGTLLASASLFGNAQLGCSDSSFCRFDLTSVKFAGIARSVSFAGNAGSVAYDNIGISAVPEPESYALLLAGLAVVGTLSLRRLR